VLAHELGHYLGLGIPDHVENTPANAGRLMLPGTNFSGDNRTLVQTEVDSARASDNAALECITLSLRVTGATQVGGTLSNHYIFVQDPDLIDPFDITVDADIPDYLLANGTLTMTDGTTTVTGRQMTVSKANTAETTVVATYSPTGGGQPVSCHVVVRVATFTLRVNGANVSPTESNVFVSFSHPTDTVTIIADINPAPFCVPTSLVTWSAGDEVPDPLRRTLPKASGGQTTITATIAGESRTVVIRILDLAFVANRPPFDDVLTEVHWDDAFRIRADIPGETRDELTVLLNSIRRP
jgi:hypothetical protein